jgi:hypothetical protein
MSTFHLNPVGNPAGQPIDSDPTLDLTQNQPAAPNSPPRRSLLPNSSNLLITSLSSGISSA